MKHTSAACIAVAAAVVFAAAATGIAAAGGEARVTQIVRDVKVLPGEAEARPAALNDNVGEGEAVRTGAASRSELTFRDMTISRLGANTIFSFNKAGHDVRLTNGSLLLRVPKGSGGGNIRTDPVTVAVTGTTVIFEHARGGRSKLIVLEGGARLSLAKVRGQARDLRAGQMLEVPAGATTLGMPVDVDLDEVMKTHPLITNFPPLPSRDLIAAAARDQANAAPANQGRPGIGLPGLPGIRIGLGGGGGGSRVTPPGPRDPDEPTDQTRPSRGQTRPRVTPTPSRRRPRTGP